MNIFDSAIVSVNIASCVHELQHAILKFGKVNQLFVVPGLDNDFQLLLRSLDIFHGDNKLLKEFLGRHGRSLDVHLGSSVNGISSFRLVVVIYSFNANWGRVMIENYFNNRLLGLKGSTNKGGVDERAGGGRSHILYAFYGRTCWVTTFGWRGRRHHFFNNLVSLVLSDRLIDDIGHGFRPKAMFVGDFVHIFDEVVVEDRGGDNDGSERERSKGRDCNGSNIGWGFFPVHVFDGAGFKGSLAAKFFGNILPRQ